MLNNNEELPALLIRKGMPNKYDHAPYKTICKVNYNFKEEFYIQLSKSEEHPRWEKHEE